MNRPEVSGFRKPIDTGNRRAVRIAVIRYTEDGYATCSCGQPFKQRRDKPREDAVDKHLRVKHAGKGIRL